MNRRVLAATFLVTGAPIPAMRAQATPYTVVSEIPFAHDFTTVGDVAVDSRGFAIAADPAESRVVLFDPAGRRVATHGRSGQGPGEFSRPGTVGVLPDGFWAADALSSRVHDYDAQLRFVRTRVLDAAGLGMRAAVFSLSNRNGSAILRRAIVVPGQRTLNGDELVRHDSGTRAARLIGVVPDIPECIVARGNTRIFLPHCERHLRGVNSEGTRLVILVVPTAVSAFANILTLSATGDTIAQRRLPVAPIPLPKRTADSIVTTRARTWGEPLGPIYAAGVRMPSHYPPFTAMTVSSDGAVWLASHSSGATVRWLHVPTTGTSFRSLDLPRSERIVASRAGIVWVVARDSDGLETMKRLELK